MRFMGRMAGIALVMSGSLWAGLPAGAGYVASVEAKRAARVQRLTRADGWLTLIGLHFLQPGESTVGRAKDNAVVLAAGPARMGVVRLEEDGRAWFTAAAGIDAQVQGEPVSTVDLGAGSDEQPKIVAVGTVSFFVIDRGGKKALRVKDSAAVTRTHFLGIDYFPVDPSWRVEAAWVPFAEPREMTFRNILGQEETGRVPGKAVFERAGHRFELLPMQDAPGEELFFVISDATSGAETYGAARFVYAEPPQDGKVVLDFNLAVNPPCAFTEFATCPLPPKENRLPIPVRAGEKKYRGAEH